MKRTSKLTMRLALVATVVATFVLGIGGIFASASTVTADPSFNFIAGGAEDMAYFNANGTVSLDVTPTPGFGFRANAANLGTANLIDVKNFTTTIELTDVPVNVSTVFSLQTVATGTLTAGNGLNFMFRRDGENLVAFAIYDSNGSEPAYWAPGQLALGTDKTVTITINYDAANIVTINLADAYALPNTLISKNIIDGFYKNTDYKGYYSISSYYFAPPATASATYTIKSINGETPLNNYKAVVNSAVTAFETAVNALDDQSTEEQIKAVKEYDVFGAGSAYASLLSLVDADNALATKIANVQAAYNLKYQKIKYNEINAQITAFSAALEGLDVSDATAVAAAIEKYEAIDKAGINTLSDTYKNQLQEALSALTTGTTFKNLINAKTESYVSDYETKVASGDAASLSTYKDINKIVEEWDTYKEENYLTISLSADEIAAYDARIAAIASKMNTSFYSSLWTEGDTWEARKTDLGLYATGEGKYFETLGFNQKLELGKTTTIEFNVIYALKKLGANHLHIGFYPQAGTGTKGSADGVRVDFWFSEAGTVEVKPVNGKTEQACFEGAYLSVEDTGFFDVDAEEPDYTQGKYTVTLSEEDGMIVLTVNGLSMDITEISPDLYKNGCYLTVSTMSVAGAAYNELLITKVGNTSYAKGAEGGDVTPPEQSSPSDSQTESEEGGCHGSLATNSIALSFVAIAICLMAITLVRKKQEN